MRKSMRMFTTGTLVAIGYFLGSIQIFSIAQADVDGPPSDDAVKKIVEANTALKNASSALESESRYSSLTKSVNPYAILVGGINVKDDLDSGNGVDPETFAALNLAAFELKKNHLKDESLADWVDTNLLGYDNDNRLTYRNKVVRMYSIERLRKLNAQRMLVLGEAKDQKSSR